MSFSEIESREIINDHKDNPRGKSEIPSTYKTVLLKNVSCGDILAVGVDLDGTIKDILHSGSGCSICCASASMMCELLKGLKIDEAKIRIQEFEKMMTRQPYKDELLGDAASLSGVSRLLPRIKCATLAWKAAGKAIGGETGEQEL